MNSEAESLRSGFNNARVLVTVGLGFIGSNLALRLLELGAEITLLDNLVPTYGGNRFNIDPIPHRVAVNIGDMRDEHLMRYLLAGQDHLFNLAVASASVRVWEIERNRFAVKGGESSRLEVKAPVSASVPYL